MSVGIATFGLFRPQVCGGDTYVGGAIIPPNTEDKIKRMQINVTSISSVDKKPSPLKIILKCSDNSGV